MDEALAAEVAKLEWFHRIDLGDGVITPGPDDFAAKLKLFDFPESFAGKTVLDIGSWNGAYSFEAERRGARDVLATDHFCWEGLGPNGKPGFDLAKRALKSKVREKVISVEDISAETVGTWDVVLFLGVFYHLPDPLMPLSNLLAVTRETLILETVIDPSQNEFPAMFYYGGLGGAPARQKFVPNEAFIDAGLRDIGFRVVEAKSPGYHEVYQGRPLYRRAFHAHR